MAAEPDSTLMLLDEWPVTLLVRSGSPDAEVEASRRAAYDALQSLIAVTNAESSRLSLGWRLTLGAARA